jgi:Tfp pilus assembly protein PilX
MTSSRNERGFALVGAIFALVIIAALIAGAFFASRTEMTVGRNTQTYQRAFGAAEAGLNNTVANWTTVGSFNALANGDSSTVTGTLPGNGGTYTTVVKRLNTELFLVRTTGTDPSGTSTRTIGAITKLLTVQMTFAASLTTRNQLKLGGSSFIDGRNTDPTSWTNCPVNPHDTLPAVLTRDSTQIQYSGCNGGSCLMGKPDIKQDTSISDSTFFKYGDTDYNELVAMSTITLASGTYNSAAPAGTATTCTIGNMNWGEPLRGAGTIAGCYNLFPIIHITGDAHITGGYGQGILLIDGDLDVQGGFEFYGPVIVRGHFSTAGTGGHFNGGLMAADVDLELNSVLGNAVLTYSNCAITRALNGNASGRLMRTRSWAEITQ